MLLGPPPPQGLEVASLDPYPQVRNQVLQRGLNSWRDSPHLGHDAARSDDAASYRELIDTMLDGPSSKPSTRPLPVMPTFFWSPFMKRRSLLPLLIAFALSASLVHFLSPVRAADEDQVQTVKLVLHPAAEPREALKYPLLPPLLDCKPGNAAIIYDKIALQLAENAKMKKALDKAADWSNVPLDKLPRGEVRKTLAECRMMLEDLDMAARREHCDWELPIREKSFLSIILPHLIKIREMSRVVALKARLEIAEGRLEDAIHTLQTGFPMARQVAQGQTLVNGLVGMAIEELMAKRVEELIAQPAAPNLYWSLTMLPRPFIDLHPALETEMNSLYLIIPGLRGIKEDRRDLSYWQHWIDELDVMMRDIQGYSPELGWRPLFTVLALKAYPVAKRALIAEGRSPQEVEAMPVPQVIVLHTLGTYRELCDRSFKWLFVPYWEGHAGLQEANRYLKREVRNPELVPVASLLLPPVSQVQAATARSDRSIVVLRTIEALRSTPPPTIAACRKC